MMEQHFLPPRQRGLIVHAVLIVLLASVSGFSMWFGLRQAVGTGFVLLVVLALLLAPLIVWLIYSGYALLQGSYSLERDGLRIRWGLRSEDVPLPDIEWIRPANQMGFHFPLPYLHLPGAILGARTVEGLGPVEYIASERDKMLLIATPHKIFVISPEDSKGFMRAFQRVMEMGSPTPLASHSAMPVAFVQRVWADRPARWLLIAGLAACVALFIYIGVAIPALKSVSLGFDYLAQPVEPGPPERLLLLPVLSIFVYAVDLMAGMFFYRLDTDRPISYMLWIGSVITPILLLIASLFMTSVNR